MNGFGGGKGGKWGGWGGSIPATNNENMPVNNNSKKLSTCHTRIIIIF